jgi:hypothetical protein
MMRTTIRLDDELLKQLKAVALESGRTMNEVVEDACREFIYRIRDARSRPRAKLTISYGEGGVFPGIDINNSAALLDIMDGLDDPH